MYEGWPHAPPHYFTPNATYIITAATLHRKQLFNSGRKLDLLRDTTFELTKTYALILQAWAFFSNHYHLVISFEDARFHSVIWCDIYTANWRYGSTVLMGPSDGE